MAAGFPAADHHRRSPTTGSSPRTRRCCATSSTTWCPLDLTEGKIHAWNVAVQRQLPWHFALEMAYVANRGRGVLARLDLNAGLVPGARQRGAPALRALRPYRLLHRLDQDQHALRLACRSSWTAASPTACSGRTPTPWAGPRTTSTTTATIGTPADVELQLRPVRLRPHALVRVELRLRAALLRRTPGVAQGAILGGWQIAGIFVAQSGHARRHPRAGASLRAPGNHQRPNLNGEPERHRRHRARPAVLRHVGLLGAGRPTRSAT